MLAHQGKIYLHTELDPNLEMRLGPRPRASAFYWHSRCHGLSPAGDRAPCGHLLTPPWWGEEEKI